MSFRVLVINPGSTSTKISVFDDDKEILKKTLRHSSEELKDFNSIIEQYEFRKNIIISFLKENNIELSSLSAVAGRGGLLHPIPSGTFLVNDDMIEDLKAGKYGEHASNLGAIIAKSIADQLGINAYIVDPVVVDELMDIARIAGHPEFKRLSIFHALNQKAVARKAAEKVGKKYEESNLIVAHLGGGISVGLHKKGKVVDVNNALDGEGPFTPERSGTLPVGQLAKICFSGKYTLADVKKMIKGKGGLVAYLGTNSGIEIEERIKKGDKYAELIYKALAYQIAKEIMSLYPGANGEIDAVVITGGLAYDNNFLIPWIKEMLGKNVNLIVIPGEMEMEALALGVLRVLNGEEKPKIYKKDENQN